MSETVVSVLALVGVAVIVAGLLSQSEARRTVILTFPRTLSADQAVAAARSLAGLLPPWWKRWLGVPSVVLDVRASAEGIGHLLSAPASRADYVLGAMRAAIPGLRIAEDIAPAADYTLARELRVIGRGALRTDTAESGSAGMLASLQPLAGDERAVIQYVISPAAGRPGWARAWLGDAAEPPPVEPRFNVALRVGVTADSAARSRQLLARLLGSFHALNSPDARLVRRLLPSHLAAGQLHRAEGGRVAVGADELAALWAVPLGAPELPGLTLASSRELPAIASVPRRGLVLGDSTVAGAGRPIAVAETEARRGIHICAPTGAGKSTILTGVAVQLMNAPTRPGLIAIDAKGDYAADLIDRIPANRRDDVIVFDPVDPKPVGFNVIGGSGDADLIVDHVVSELRARYGAAGLGPRSEDILRSCLATLAAQPERYTLCEVEPLLTNVGFRQRLISTLDDPVLQSFWGWYESQSDAARSEAIAPLSNKLRTYTLRRRVRAVIGQANGLDLAAALDGGQIVVVSLATGTVGEDAAALIGTAMISRLWAAIQARAGLPPEKRRAATVICDEFQTFASAASSSVFADAVSRSRSFAVSWVLAHQHLAQLDTPTRQAVLANCRTRLVMQTTAADSTAFAKEFRPYLTPDDLQGLGAFEGYAAVSTGSAVAAPASLHTRPAPDLLGSAGTVRATSRARYGLAPAAVDAAIRARIERFGKPAPIGETRRPS